ncbi:hypothetical protein CL634_06075 [bacterium]|nr:hypothetical protein [bacterium]|tara:strand:+ start:454 stop:897 length:444 start_codon:yes stop_codon:yes gene_type:complete
MSLAWPNQNWNFVPAYEISGVPWVKSYTDVPAAAADTATEIAFSAVTRWVTVSIQDAVADSALRIGFTALGVESEDSQANYFLLWSDASSGTGQSAQTVRFEVRCQKLFIAGHEGVIDNVSVMAGLTTVNISNSLMVTGSNNFEGVG